MRQRPALERLGQQRVIGVAEQVWRVMPQARSQSMAISSTSRRMSSATAIDGCVSFIWTANFSWKRSGGIFWTLQMRSMSCSEQRHEEVLLLEPQLLAPRLLVVRIQHLGEVLAGHLLVDRAVVVAAIEGAEVEGLGRLGLPQAQRVGRVDVVAEDGRVVGNAVDDAARHPARALAAEFVVPDFGVAAELHLAAPLGPRDLPGIAVAQPLVGLLHLPAVDDLLLEDAELVADAVTQRRHFERGQRIDETRGEPAEAAVAQARLVLVRQQLFEVEARARPPPCARSRRCRD